VLRPVRKPARIERGDHLDLGTRQRRLLFSCQRVEDAIVFPVQQEEHVRLGIAGATPSPSIRAALTHVAEDPLAMLGTADALVERRVELRDEIARETDVRQPRPRERDVDRPHGRVRIESRAAHVERAQPCSGCCRSRPAEQQIARAPKAPVSEQHDALDVV
jgi:hypothetical protein